MADSLIQINKTLLKGKLSAIVKSYALLDVTRVNSIPNASSCDGIMIEEYIKCAKEMSDMLKLFKTLLMKDVADIEKTLDAYQEADQNALHVLHAAHGSESQLL